LSDTLLSFNNVSKSYQGNAVLNGISFDVHAGEIHALVGENGAGKSTLMNVLFGMPVIHSTGGYEGDVVIDGKKAFIKSPFEALDAGIAMVHQEFMLIPGFTITENIKINREITAPNIFSKILGKRLEFLDMIKMNADARKALDTLDIDIEEFVLVEGLPVGHKQFIEIAREIDKTGIKILVFDEPTAVLTESEAKNLLVATRRLSEMGIGIIFISHRLDEIIDVADRVTVLRDGQLVTTKETKDTDVIELAKLMVGRSVSIDRTHSDQRKISDEVMLGIKNLRVGMPGEMVKGVSLEVRRGEIIGIGGLAGQGKLGIANGIMGTCPAAGEVTFDGKPLLLNSARSAIASGMAFVSEDRKGVGLLLDESIELNIAFTAMQVNGQFLKKIAGLGVRNDREIRENADRMIKELDIRCRSPLQHTGSLSGGNQQKVCVARALTQKPKFLFVSEPTRGIDIGAKKLILDLLLKLNEEEGLTIVMTSSELAELRSICDKIVIICAGAVAGVLPPDAGDADFGLMMSGSVVRAKEAGNTDE